MEVRKIRYFIFLRDVAWLALTAFGGPQVHITVLLDLLVGKRRYVSEKEFWELHALCQILPGPTSSQTIVTIGFKLGGASLAYLTLLIWCLPSVLLMTALGILIAYLHAQKVPLDFMYFVQPIAIGFVCHAALTLSQKIINTKTGFLLLLVAGILSYVFPVPWVFPIVIVGGGIITASFKFEQQKPEEKPPFKIDWANFFLFAGTGLGLGVLGWLTGWLWVRMGENFYRNGSFIYGGGQVLIPVLFTEFVKFKKYLSPDEFLSGYGMVQLIPGPVFSFVAFIGVLTMRDHGIGWQIVGGFVASITIFLPSAFIMFFVIRIWDRLKSYRFVKASIEGINASSAGLVIGGALLFLVPIASNPSKLSLVIVSFTTLLFFNKARPMLIILGLLAGIAYQFFG